MKYKYFELFIKNFIETLYGDKVEKLQNSLDKKLFVHIYEKLLSYMESDLIKILYTEYQIFTEFDEKKNNKVKKFIDYINKKEFVKYIINKYKSLYEKIEVKINDYINYAFEIIRNFENDKKYLIKNGLLSMSDGIDDIILFQGDIHNGKTAAKVKLEGGEYIYYKPCNDLNLNMFYSIVNELGKYSTKIFVKNIKECSVDDHMWMESVIYKTCKSKEQVVDYYFTCGVYLLVFYILGSFDMHYENLINVEQSPVIIDFETLAHAPMSKIRDITKFKDSVQSVINSAFIPYVNENGAFDVNVSGILSHSQNSKHTIETICCFNEERGFYLKQMPAGFNIEGQVTLNGNEIVDNILSLDEISKILKNGFEVAANILIKHKKRFCALICQFMENHNMELRQLLRPTQVYHQFIQTCMMPEILESEKNEDKILLILENNFKPSDHGYLRVEEEIQKIKKGYIPKFYTYGDSRDLYSDHNLICKDFFTDSIESVVRKKIELLDCDQIEYQKHIIDLSIMSLGKQNNFGGTIVTVKVNSNSYITRQYVDYALDGLMERLYSYIIDYDNDISTMFMPHLTDREYMWSIKDMAINLYEYSALVLLFIFYGKIYGKNKFVEQSLKMLNYFNLKSIELKKDNVSVFLGRGSLLYLNLNVYRVLKKMMHPLANKYKQIADNLEDEILKELEEKDWNVNDFDYISGSITALGLIAKKQRIDNSHDLSNRINHALELCMNAINIESLTEIGYAHGITGTAVCISDILRYSSNERSLFILEKIISHENDLVRIKGIENMKPTWCRGSIGLFMGRNRIWNNLKALSAKHCQNISKEKVIFWNEEYFCNEINRALAEGNNLCLCHGIYGNIEALNNIDAINFDKKMLYKKYFDDFEHLKWIDFMTIPYDSFMLGNSGIGYVLLELFNAEIPSFLGLDIA